MSMTCITSLFGGGHQYSQYFGYDVQANEVRASARLACA